MPESLKATLQPAKKQRALIEKQKTTAAKGFLNTCKGQTRGAIPAHTRPFIFIFGPLALLIKRLKAGTRAEGKGQGPIKGFN